MKSARLLRVVACAVVPAAVAACADRTPVARDPADPPSPPPAVTRLACEVDVRAGTIDCGAPAPGGARGDLLVGGQDFYVKLRSANAAFSAPTFSADVSLQNLLPQPMGTTDGTTPAASGVRIFFASQPVTTGGTGNVTVQNPDGTGTFTAAGQPYFQYPGILAPGATSAARTWQFQLDPGVTLFTFSVYVAAPLPRENGWVTIYNQYPTLGPGQRSFIQGTVYDGTGRQIENAPVTWASSDTTVATVDTAGTLTAVGFGSATIIATSGPRTGTAQVTVAAVDTVAPELTGISFSPDTASPGDTVLVSYAVSDVGTGVSGITGTMRLQPQYIFGIRVTCASSAPSAGTRNNGTFTCAIPLPPGAKAGPWTFTTVGLGDLRGNQGQYTTAQLGAAGFPTGFTVVNPAPDTIGPDVVFESMSPSSVSVGDTLTFTFPVTDAGTGVAKVEQSVQDPNFRTLKCTTTTLVSGTVNNGTWACKLPIPPGSRPGIWTKMFPGLTDRTGNLAFHGSQFNFMVSGPAPDTTPPTLRSVSFSSPTVSRTDSVTVTLGVADAGSGVVRVAAFIRAPTYTFQLRSCEALTPVSGTAAFGTFQCRISFRDISEVGTWSVLEVDLYDAAGNLRYAEEGDLRVLGHPYSVEVTP